VPNLTWPVWVQLVPLTLMFVPLWLVARTSYSLMVGTLKFWEYAGYGYALAAVTYWIMLALLVRWLRRPWAAWVFAWFYLLLYGVNAAMVYHAGTMLEPHFLRMLEFDVLVLAYITKWVWVLVGFLALNCAGAALLIHKHREQLARLRLPVLVAVALFLWVAPVLQAKGLFRPTATLARVAGQGVMAGAWRLEQTETLRMLARNPLHIFAKAVLERPDPLVPRPVAELSQAAGAIRAYDLPLGPRAYPPLGLKPFNHIIVFAVESLSLDFLAPYNAHLTPEISPFYGSAEIRQAMFTNYQTIALPTRRGISAMYCSHPNGAALLVGGSELSLIKLLKHQGYRTIMWKSSSETFQNEHIIFPRLGFEDHWGVETWERSSTNRPYIEGRGLMDRVLFDKVLSLMEEYRGKKLFLHIISQDTHSPNPREFYGSLDYPPDPPSISRIASPEAAAVVRGVFRHDYDLGLTIQKMRARGLLTEDTLVVLTADHNYPQAIYLQTVPGFPNAYYSRITLAFLSGQALPQADRYRLRTQLDFAPTLLHLLNLPIPAGYWGTSVFTDLHSTSVSELYDRLTVEHRGEQRVISIASPEGPEAAGLIDLYRKVYLDPAK
jgi:hypothetical protein